MFNLINIRIKTALRSAFAFRPQNIIRLSSYFFAISVFLLGGGFLFYSVFRYLESVEIIGAALEMRIIGLAFLIFLTLILLSSIITGLSTFFRSKEVEFLMSLPIPCEKIFSAKFIENTFYCSWATVLAAVPLIIAFGISRHYVFGYYPVSFLALLLFVLIPASIGIIVLLFFINIFKNITRRKIAFIIIIATSLFLVFLFVKKPSVLRVPYTDNLEEINNYVEQLRMENPLMPSDHLVKFLKKPFSIDSSKHLLLLFTTALFSLSLCYGAALVFYQRGWNQIFANSSAGTKMQFSNLLFRFLKNFKIPDGINSLVVKDMRMFTRLPAQWGQALIFFVLLLTYIISLKRTPYYFKVPYWLAVISFINLGFTGYIVATLSTRFVYPAISLEGRAISILFSSPIKLKEFFVEKFLVSFVPNWLLAEFIIIFSNIFLKNGVIFTLIGVGVTTIYTLTVVSISIGFGARFPDFTETNPSKIAAGGGGVLTAILSLVYIALSTVVIALPTRRFIALQFQLEPFHSIYAVFWFLLFLLISFVFSFFSLRGGMRSLKRLEI